MKENAAQATELNTAPGTCRRNLSGRAGIHLKMCIRDSTMRINYSNSSDEAIEKGIKILGDTIKEMLAK